jgi:L-malate glycosyltransferase
MKSLMIPAWFGVDPDDYTGVYVIEHAKAVQTAGWKSDLLYLNRSGSNKSRCITKDGIGLFLAHKWFPPKYGILTRVWQMQYKKIFRAYCDHEGRPDIIHAHSYIGGLAALAISKEFRIPYVLTEHSSNFLTGLSSRHASFVRNTYRQCNKLIAVSSFLAEKMSAYSKDQRIKVIPNPVDRALFPYRKSVYDPVHPKFITVSSLIKSKHVDRLIRAFIEVRKYHPDARLIIIGEGKEEAGLRKLADQSGVRDALVFKGALSLNEVSAELRTSDIYVSSSAYETFGVSIVEALMTGLPVVCTPSGGPQSFVHDGNALITAGFEVEDLVTGMLHILDNYRSYNSEEIRKSAIARYSLEIVGQQIAEAYERVLDQYQA